MNDQQEILDCIKRRIDEGWDYGPVELGDGTYQFIVPPEGDPRRTWCAEWKRVTIDGTRYMYPHWIREEA